MARITYYYYNQLNSRDQATYTAILNAVLNVDESVRIYESNGDTLGNITQLLLSDHPEIFWWAGACGYTIYNDHTIFEPKYLYDRWTVASRQKQIENKINAFSRHLRFGMSDYDKVKTVFEYVIDTVEYIDGAPDNQTICGSLINGRCVCAGYARAVQYLLQRMGMECLYVSGVTKGKGSHAWNIVKCGNKYYQLDATFGDRSFDQGSPSNFPEEIRINYSYLCCTDERMYADRRSDMPCTLPTCYSNDLNYYVKMGRYYQSYSQAVLDDIRRAIFSGKRVWECQFANRQDYLAMMRDIDNGVFSDIVKEYYRSIRWTGSFTTWNSNKDEMQTIVVWY